MTHADILRGIGNGPHPGLSRSGSATMLSGADALDLITEALEGDTE